MRVVIYSAGNGQQFRESSAVKQPFQDIAGHGDKGLVDVNYSAVNTRRNVAARSVLKQLRDATDPKQVIIWH
jgi:hypothetical protein